VNSENVSSENVSSENVSSESTNSKNSSSKNMSSEHSSPEGSDLKSGSTDVPRFDLIIVGAGMVGLAQAAILANETELRIAVIEAGSFHQDFDETNWDARVVALSAASRELLERCNAWPEQHGQRSCAYKSMYVWDAEGTGNIEFNARDIHEAQLGHIIENRIVVKCLLNALSEKQHTAGRSGDHIKDSSKDSSKDKSQSQNNGQVTLISDTRVEDFTYDDENKFAELYCGEDKIFRGSLIIAADGANSPMRELAEISTREWDYGHTAIVSTVKLGQPHKFCAWQRFATEGPLAFLPLSRDGREQQHASIVWSVKSDQADALMALDEDGFNAAITRCSESCLGSIELVDKRYAIALRQRHAQKYFKQGLALIGDASHTIHPLAGQGVNLGFYDVNVLTEEILRAVSRQIPLQDISILKRFERRRQPHNLSTMASMEFFKKLFGSDRIELRWLRNEGMKWMDKQFMFKKYLSRAAAGKI
ncbi:MAG: 2-octaprenylphenol hydroxylase, partial [Flavobacteriales bacterium]